MDKVSVCVCVCVCVFSLSSCHLAGNTPDGHLGHDTVAFPIVIRDVLKEPYLSLASLEFTPMLLILQLSHRKETVP